MFPRDSCSVIIYFPVVDFSILPSAFESAACLFSAVAIEKEQVEVQGHDKIGWPAIQFELVFEKQEDVEMKVNTMCGIEEIGEPMKGSLLSCLQSLFLDLEECENEFKLDIEKDAHVFDNVEEKVSSFWSTKYESKWSFSSLNFLRSKQYDSNILSFATTVSGKNDNFSLPLKPIIDDSSNLPSLNQLLSDQSKFAETFSLIVLHHPKHLQHLRVLHSVEKKFAKALNSTYAQWERVLSQLKDQQNLEMELASKNETLLTGDMKQIADLVFQHEKQKQDAEKSFLRDLQSAKAKQRRNFIEFIFNFYQQHILPSMLIVPRSAYSRLQSNYPPWQHPKRYTIQSVPLLRNISNLNVHSEMPPLPSSVKANVSLPFAFTSLDADRTNVEPVKTLISPKLVDILSATIWLGGQSKTKFRLSLCVGDFLDVLACDYTETSSVASASAASDPNLIISRSSIFHSLYSDHSLAGCVVLHESSALGEIVPFPFDADISAELKEQQLRLSARDKQIAQTIDRYTDYHFPTLSEQFLSFVNKRNCKKLISSSLTTQKNHISTLNHSVDNLEKISNMFAEVEGDVSFGYHPATISVLDSFSESVIISRQILDFCIFQALKRNEYQIRVESNSLSSVRHSQVDDQMPSPLVPGDFAITRHSNLRDAHILFHLFGTRENNSLSETNGQRVIEGVKQTIITADQIGVSVLSVPVLLSGLYSGTKHAIPMAIQRELDQIFRAIRAALHAVAQRRSTRPLSRHASLCELKLIIPLRNQSGISMHESNLVKHARYAFNESFG